MKVLYPCSNTRKVNHIGVRVLYSNIRGGVEVVGINAVEAHDVMWGVGHILWPRLSEWFIAADKEVSPQLKGELWVSV